MPHFHVLVASKAQPTRFECIMWDLDKIALRKRFVRPFRASKEIMAEGRLYRRSDMAAVRIQLTEDASAPALKRLRDQSWAAIEECNRTSTGAVLVSAGDGHSHDDLLLVGTDVTDRFLKTDALSTSRWRRVKDDPWLVAVGGGLLVLAIAAVIVALYDRWTAA